MNVDTVALKVVDASELEGAVRNQGALKMDPLNGCRVLITAISDQVSQYGSSVITVTLLHNVSEVGAEGEAVEVWANRNMQKVVRAHFARRQNPIVTILAKDPIMPGGAVVRGWQMLPSTSEFSYDPDGGIVVHGQVPVAPEPAASASSPPFGGPR